MKRIFYISVFLFFIASFMACHSNKPSALKGNINQPKVLHFKADSIEVGDCFIFSDSSLQDFGLLTIEKGIYLHSFIPVKLNINEKNILERFIKGQIYLNSYPDLANMQRHIEGFHTFEYENDSIPWLLNNTQKVGHLNLNPEYLQITGASLAYTKYEYRRAFDLWNVVFNNKGKLITVKEIMR